MSHARSAAMRRAEEAANPDITYQTDALTETYAYNQVNKVRKEPGPATTAAPRATIGKEERFSSTFAGMFIRAEAASELQCRDSPGPIYSPSFSNMPRSQTVSWGVKPTKDEIGRRAHEPITWVQGAEVGPAAYHPRIEKVQRTTPSTRFGRADRFMSFGGAYSLNNSPWTSDGPKGPPLDIAPIRPRSAAYSFGGGKVRPARGNDPSIRSRPRTAFLTHSIRGGLARPATLECGIGPADYSTDQTAINRNLKPAGVNKFGSAPRFVRPGLMFVSAEHAKADGNTSSPGPKYASNVNSLTFKPRGATNALHWCP